MTENHNAEVARRHADADALQAQIDSFTTKSTSTANNLTSIGPCPIELNSVTSRLWSN
jgi:hypothetical protein